MQIFVTPTRNFQWQVSKIILQMSDWKEKKNKRVKMSPVLIQLQYFYRTTNTPGVF